MTRAEALAQVAQHAAALLGAGTFSEATGTEDEWTISEADADRLAWAVEEVQRRLRRMGKRAEP